jgi:hypothetical protein
MPHEKFCDSTSTLKEWDIALSRPRFDYRIDRKNQNVQAPSRLNGLKTISH